MMAKRSWNPFDWFSPETKASASGAAISTVNVGNPVWSERDYANFAREAYTRNAIAYRCISMKAQAFASIPLLLKNGDKDIDDHPMIDLIKRPAPGMTKAWLFESMATYYDLSGQSYIERVGPERKGVEPQELWALRPDRMQVIQGRQGLPQAYRYEANGTQVNWDVDPISGDCAVLHVRRFNPIDDWYGLSSVEPASYAIDRHNEAGSHNMAVLQNGAAPSGALMFRPVKQDGEMISAPKEIIAQAEERLRSRFSGAKNAGRPMVLGGDVDWVSFGMTMEELQLTESKLDAARDICAAFGVPIELLLPGESTFNNKREAKLNFYEESVLPLAETFIDHLNIWLAPRFGEGLELIPNLDEIEALSLRREIRQKNTLELYKENVISRDEAREALQFEPEPNHPQQKVDAPVLTSLVNAAAKDDAMFLPLFSYMQSVGLIPEKMTMEEFVSSTSDLFEDDEPSQEELAAALSQEGSAEEDQLEDEIGTKAAGKTLYAHRPLLNADELIKWAKDAGFSKTVEKSEIHVTFAFSKKKFDWSGISEDKLNLILSPKGARRIGALGDKGAIVLHFESKELKKRWEELKDAGASWDYPSFQPHITITYDGGDIDLDSLEPFMGKLKFGGEVFSEIDDGALDRVRANEKGLLK